MVRKSPVCTLFVFVVIFKINNEVSMHDEGGGAELTMGLRVDLSGTRAKNCLQSWFLPFHECGHKLGESNEHHCYRVERWLSSISDLLWDVGLYKVTL